MWRVVFKFLTPVAIGFLSSVVADVIDGALSEKPKRKTKKKT